jgi:ABC-type lipoprotein release transport system permease subunit
MKLGMSAGIYLIGVGIGVFLGVITYQLVSNFTHSLTPAPTGTDALIIQTIPTFLAIAIMMLPVGSIYFMSAGTGAT